VRFAKNGETFVALDDKTYELSSNDIVIADSEKILAL
jgi:phenylalanyl-tRNA synthetase beta subunit